MRPALCPVFLLLSPLVLFAQEDPRLSWLGTEELARLRREGFFQSTAASLDQLGLLRRAPFRAEILSTLRSTRPNVVVEGLFWLPTPRMSPEQAQLRFFQLTLSFSRMRGMKYWSVSRKRFETLILEIYRVRSPAQRDRLPDSVPQTLLDSAREFFFQRDNTFGDGIYELSMKNRAGSSLLVLTNAERVHWGVLPLVDPGKLRFVFLAQFLPEGILIYGLSGAETFQLFGLERSREESFFNRLRALADWVRLEF